MPAATAISVSEYLNTSYRPDCDYLDGELLERNAGELDQGRDYLSFGVSYVWLINPRTNQSFIYTSSCILRAKDGILTTKNLDIRVDLSMLE